MGKSNVPKLQENMNKYDHGMHIYFPNNLGTFMRTYHEELTFGRHSDNITSVLNNQRLSKATKVPLGIPLTLDDILLYIPLWLCDRAHNDMISKIHFTSDFVP